MKKSHTWTPSGSWSHSGNLDLECKVVDSCVSSYRPFYGTRARGGIPVCVTSVACQCCFLWEGHIHSFWPRNSSKITQFYMTSESESHCVTSGITTVSLLSFPSLQGPTIFQWRDFHCSEVRIRFDPPLEHIKLQRLVSLVGKNRNDITAPDILRIPGEKKYKTIRKIIFKHRMLRVYRVDPWTSSLRVGRRHCNWNSTFRSDTQKIQEIWYLNIHTSQKKTQRMLYLATKMPTGMTIFVPLFKSQLCSQSQLFTNGQPGVAMVQLVYSPGSWVSPGSDLAQPWSLCTSEACTRKRQLSWSLPLKWIKLHNKVKINRSVPKHRNYLVNNDYLHLKKWKESISQCKMNWESQSTLCSPIMQSQTKSINEKNKH